MLGLLHLIKKGKCNKIVSNLEHTILKWYFVVS